MNFRKCATLVTEGREKEILRGILKGNFVAVAVMALAFDETGELLCYSAMGKHNND